MILDMNSPIRNYDGTPGLENRGTEESPRLAPIVMRDLLLRLLNGSRQAEDLPIDEKMRVFSLSVRIAADDAVDISAEDEILIIRQVGANGTPLAIGRITEALHQGRNPLGDAAAAQNGNGVTEDREPPDPAE